MADDKLKFLIYDFGLCTENAVRLARDGYEVKYFVPWEDAFPKSSKAITGEGLEGVDRVLNFWDWVDWADIICCFDTYTADLVEYLRKKGYLVFGAGQAEILENNRWKMRQLQKEIGLPTHKTEHIKGVENLINYLKENQNKWVKLNVFRGDIETFFHKEYDTTQAQFLGDLLRETGAKASKIEFVVEDDIKDALEPGYDGFVVDGEYPNMAMWGFERKGIGYIGKVQRYDELPEPIRLINERMKPLFRQYGGRTFFSDEIRVTDRGIGYLIDPCIRCPMPVPTAVHLEIWGNISDFIINATQGKLIDLKPIAHYGAGICFESDWAEKHWTEIKFPPKYRQWIKLRMACKVDGKYYALPGFKSVGSIIGLGHTVDEAIANVEKVVKTVEVKEIGYSLSGLYEIRDEIIKKSGDFDIPF